MEYRIRFRGNITFLHEDEFKLLEDNIIELVAGMIEYTTGYTVDMDSLEINPSSKANFVKKGGDMVSIIELDVDFDGLLEERYTSKHLQGPYMTDREYVPDDECADFEIETLMRPDIALKLSKKTLGIADARIDVSYFKVECELV